jgi:hypothetical protein
MPQGLVQPTNAILYGGQPLVREMEVLTATTMIPGRLVMTDSAEGTIKVCTTGATTALGVLDIEPGNRRTTSYDAGDQARVLSGPIIVLMTVAAMGTATAVGSTMIPAASGQIQPGTTAGAIVGIALQAVGTGTSAEILVLLEI